MEAAISQEFKKVESILHTVLDPEVPVLSVMDLGIVRNIVIEGDAVEIQICPTYSGCPALDVIATDIKLALVGDPFEKVNVKYVYEEAWTTDMISEEGRRKLKEYGIAAPQYDLEKDNKSIPCPMCESRNTEQISEFGSTACKALHRCKDCLEPFDYFKCR